MKKLFIIIIISGIAFKSYCQFDTTFTKASEQKNAVTIGILEGGGSLLGADLEIGFLKYFGVQIGAGLVGFGAGIDIHFKPKIQSSFFSIQLWHQGINDSYTQMVIGPNYVYRGKKWFTCQVGIGFLMEEGPAWPNNKEHPSTMLTYAIGGYIPW